MSKTDGEGSGAISRRVFGRCLAVSGAAVFVPPLPIGSVQENASSGLNSTAAKDDVEARYQSVVRRWGDRLSEEQKQRVRQVLSQNERMLDAMHSFQLANGDPPAPVLRFCTDAALAAAEDKKAINNSGAKGNDQ